MAMVMLKVDVFDLSTRGMEEGPIWMGYMTSPAITVRASVHTEQAASATFSI